jgi:hypothetical protein
MIRDEILKKIKRQSEGRGEVTRLARLIGIPIVTLWRIKTGKFQGSIKTWDAIFKYYGK